MDTAYTDAVAAYLRERDAADAEIAAADRTYRRERAELDAAVEAARADRDRADADAQAAAALVAATDTAVNAAWRTLTGFVGHRRTGAVPYRDGAGEPDAATVRTRLARAERLLTLARQGELPIEAPRHTELTAAAVGAGLATAAVATAAATLGGDDATAARGAVAAAALFLGVAAGPVVVGAWLSWQYRVRPRPTQIVACVATALAATCALAGLFLRGM